MIRAGGTNDVGGHKLKDGMMDRPEMSRGGALEGGGNKQWK